MRLDRSLFEGGPLDAASYWDARWARTATRTLSARSSGEERLRTSSREDVAVRALVSGAWGFASTGLPTDEEVRSAARDAATLGQALGKRIEGNLVIAHGPRATGAHSIAARDDPFTRDLGEAMTELRALMKLVPSTVEGTVRLAFRREEKHILGAHGADVAAALVRSSCSIDVTDKKSGQSVGKRLGGTGGSDLLPRATLEEATRDALVKLDLAVHARQLPTERLPVVVDHELTGVLAHEAVGHGCEADLVLAGESLFADLVGERVGTDQVTIVDDPGRASGYGQFDVDDEGTRARPRTLVEKGIVRGFIHSLETASRMGHEPNGGARAQDGASEPIPRMSNTMFLGGSWTEDELWERAGRCIFVAGTRGGQVDTTRGTFQFTPQEAYLVERGEVAHAVRGAGLSGTVLATLKSVEAATRTERLGGPGMCGKGQWVPVGDGGPLILVRDVEVG